MVRIASLWADIWTWELPYTKQEFLYSETVFGTTVVFILLFCHWFISLYSDILRRFCDFKGCPFPRFCEQAVHSLGVQSVNLLIKCSLPQAGSSFVQVMLVTFILPVFHIHVVYCTWIIHHKVAWSKCIPFVCKYLSVYSVQSSVETTYLALLCVFQVGSGHATTVSVNTSAVLWHSRCNKGKQ
jgi:hypothetical protein